VRPAGAGRLPGNGMPSSSSAPSRSFWPRWRGWRSA